MFSKKAMPVLASILTVAYHNRFCVNQTLSITCTYVGTCSTLTGWLHKLKSGGYLSMNHIIHRYFGVVKLFPFSGAVYMPHHIYKWYL